MFKRILTRPMAAAVDQVLAKREIYDWVLVLDRPHMMANMHHDKLVLAATAPGRHSQGIGFGVVATVDALPFSPRSLGAVIGVFDSWQQVSVVGELVRSGGLVVLLGKKEPRGQANLALSGGLTDIGQSSLVTHGVIKHFEG